MQEQYDVIVVGAGPAGFLAAKAAGLAGCSVALIDRKTDLTILERLCGQTLVSMNDYYFDDLLNYNKKGKRIGFLKSGFSFRYDGPVKNLNAWYLYSPDGSRIALGVPEETRKMGDDGAVGLSIDKEALFRCLLEEVTEAGVDVIAGVNIEGVTSSADGVTVSGKNRNFACRYLIASDGANSRIARILGFNKERTFYCYLIAKGWCMRNVKLPEPDVIAGTFTYKPVAPGVMFVMPRATEDEATAIFLTLDPRVNLDDVVEYFMKENPFFSEWFKGVEIGRERAFSQYVASPITEPYRDRVLIAGDAGSCQELENTGAMLSGWKAGNAVAAALKEDRVGIESRGISEYLNWWKTVYLEGHPHEVYLMNFSMPYVLDSEELVNYIFSLVKEPFPPCYNPYGAMGLLGQRIQGIVPTIQKERPDIMPKLAKMSAPISQILEKTTKACEPFPNFE